MMNYPGVLSKDSQTLSKLIAVGSRPKDGCSTYIRKIMDAYVIAGLGIDHECTSLKKDTQKSYGRVCI